MIGPRLVRYSGEAAGALRLLKPRDLDDPARFSRTPNVPLLDAHGPTERSDSTITPRMLRVAAKNTNERCRSGNYPPVLLGHTRDGKAIPEAKQPEMVGVASSFRVAEYEGTPCLFGDLFIFADRVEEAGEYPFRSIEHIHSDQDKWNYVEAVSLLRRAPESSLGLLIKKGLRKRSGR